MKLVLAALVLWSGHFLAMERVQAQQAEPLTTLFVGESKTPLQIPLRHAKLIGSITELIGSEYESFPLPDLPLEIASIVFCQLERICQILHLHSMQADHQDIKMHVEAIQQYLLRLPGNMLVEALRAADFLGLPIFPKLLHHIMTKDLDICNIPSDSLSSLPSHLCNPIILHHMKLFLSGSKILKGHTDAITSLSTTQDGKLVSSSLDGTIRLWDANGNALAVYRTDSSVRYRAGLKRYSTFHITRDNKLVAGTSHGAVQICDGGYLLTEWTAHESAITSICETYDGKILTASEGNTIKIWNRKGVLEATCTGHRAPITAVCTTPDGTIVSGSRDRTIRIWNSEGREVAQCEGHTGPITALRVTTDGKIFSGSADRTIRVWNMQGNELLTVQKLACRMAIDNMVIAKVAMALTRDNTILCGYSDNRQMAEYSSDCTLRRVWRGHDKDDGYILSLSEMEDGTIITGGTNSLHIWARENSLRPLAICKAEEGEIRFVCEAKPGFIASGSEQGAIRLWDLARILELKSIDQKKLLEDISTCDPEQAGQVWAILQKCAKKETKPNEGLESIAQIVTAATNEKDDATSGG